MSAPAAESTANSGAPLKHSVRRGARVAVWAQVTSQLISLLVLATLYRVLKVDDYGLFGVVLPILMLVRNLATLGMGAAAVQREEMTPDVASALFWWNLWIGLATSALTMLAAPLVGWLYGNPFAGWLTFSLSGASLIASLGTQHQALLERQLAWRPLAVSRLWGQAIAGFIALQCALRGFGVWSLVAQQYVEVVVSTALFWWYEPFRPTRLKRHAESRRLLGFGSHFAGAGLMFFIAGNIDKILLGALKAPEQAAAFYTQSFNFMMRPVSLLTAPLNSLMLPALARARDDAATFREVYLGFQRLIAIVLFPASIGLKVTAIHVMLLLGGDDWHGAGEVLSTLAFTIAVQGFVNTASSAFAAIGRTDRLLVSSIGFALVMSAVCFSVLQLNPQAYDLDVILARWYKIAIWTLFVPYQWFCLKALGIPFTDWLVAVRRAFFAAAGMGLVVMAVGELAARQLYVWVNFKYESEPAWVMALLSLEVAVGVLSYVLFAWPECRWLLSQWRRRESEPE